MVPLPLVVRRLKEARSSAVVLRSTPKDDAFQTPRVLPQRAHENGLFIHVGIGPLQGPGHVEDRLQVAQSVIVVVLR